MIFSDVRVASLIRDRFVAAWDSVRPVPTLEIDFGNGRKIRRTLNGNIAAYVCAPDGRVLDVIPGLNTPESFLEDLRLALNLYRAAERDFDRTVLDYHRANLSAPTVYEWVRDDLAKSQVERLMRMSIDMRRDILERGGLGLHIVRKAAPSKDDPGRPAGALGPEESAILAADTEINRRERKPVLHRILSEKIVRPADITLRVYKEALQCDLEDPYLGLVSKAFFGGAYEHP